MPPLAPKDGRRATIGRWGWAVPPNTYQPPEIKSAQASAANAENLEVERGFVSVLIVSGIFALGLPLVLL